MRHLLVICLIWTLHYAKGQFRLPQNVVPTQYDLRLIFDIETSSNFSYYGVVNILFQAVTVTSKVVFNSNGIQLLNKDLKVRNIATGTDIAVESTLEDKENQLYNIVLASSLELNTPYSLTLAFYGNLSMHNWNQNRAGVHVIRYVNRVDNNDIDRSSGTAVYDYAVATKFEPIGARTLFPCFDEPQFRAFFTVAIGRHKLYRSIFNTPRLYTTADQSMDPYFSWDDINKTFKKSQNLFEWDHFEKTGIISTYRLGFVIHKYFSMNHAIAPAFTTTVVSTRTQVSQKFLYQTNFTLDHGSKILSHYEAYFNMPCEPRQIEHTFHSSYDFVSSSSLGIVNYAELMLQDNLQSMLISPFFLIQVMSKETALQWFGNTVPWWNDHWLKEGLAIFLSQLSLATLLSDYKIPETAYKLRPFMKILEDDSHHTYTIQLPMEMTHPAHINDYSRRTFHNKAGYIFNMLHKLLGPETFQDAIRNFLAKSSQGPGTENLWAEMSKSRIRREISLPNNITEKILVDSWTNQPGYPFIKVTRDYYNKSLSITQKLYAFDEDEQSQGWVMPFQVLVQGEEPWPLQWLVDVNGTSGSADFQHNIRDDAWVLLSTDMTAPCRIHYDSVNWELLIVALSTPGDREKIPAASRAQLLADAHELAKYGHIDYDSVFQLYHSLSMEMDPDVLENGLEQLDSIGLRLQRTPQYALYNEFVKMIILNHNSQLEIKSYWDMFTTDHIKDVDYQDSKLYLMISEWSCKMNILNQAEFYINLFTVWQTRAEAEQYSGFKSKHLHKILACVGVSRGTPAHWEFVLHQISGNYQAVDQTSLINGLACTREPWLLQRTLEMLIEGRFEIAPNVASIVKTAVHNPVGYYVGKDFIYKRSSEIFNGYSAQAMTLALITHLLEQFIDLSELTEFSTWYKEHNDALVSLGINTTVHRILHSAHYNIVRFHANWADIMNQLTIYSKNERLSVRDKTQMKLKSAPANKSSKIVLTNFYSFISYILCSMLSYTLY